MASTHTTVDDWKAVATFLHGVAAANSFAEVDEFAPPELRRLFRADLIAWERYDNHLRHLAYRLDPQPLAAMDKLHEAFTRHFPEHPGYSHFLGTPANGLVVTLSDFSSTRKFLQTGLWREVYCHLHGKHQLAIVGRIDSGAIFAIGLNRLGRDYGPRERELARFLRSRLRQAYRSVSARERARRAATLLGDFFHHDHVAYARVAPDGTILEISPRARQRLAQLQGTEAANLAALPQAAADLRAELQRAAGGRQGFALIRVAPSLHALVLHGPRKEHGTLVIFQEDGAIGRASPRAPLTPRESEIFHWLGEGKSNAEIARVLGISVRTVGKHCESLFAKIGVETRLAAALMTRPARH